jgi:transcriptional regulator with XRE-family HTH domain
MIYFDKNLFYLRTGKGKKIHEIAQENGFSRTQWTNYENNLSFPKFLDLIKIAKYFDVSESDLIHKNLEIETPSKIVKEKKIEESQFDIQNKLIAMQEKEIARLEKELEEFRYNSQKEPVLYRTVAESPPELIKKESK